MRGGVGGGVLGTVSHNILTIYISQLSDNTYP